MWPRFQVMVEINRAGIHTKSMVMPVRNQTAKADVIDDFSGSALADQLKGIEKEIEFYVLMMKFIVKKLKLRNSGITWISPAVY